MEVRIQLLRLTYGTCRPRAGLLSLDVTAVIAAGAFRRIHKPGDSWSRKRMRSLPISRPQSEPRSPHTAPRGDWYRAAAHHRTHPPSRVALAGVVWVDRFRALDCLFGGVVALWGAAQSALLLFSLGVCVVRRGRGVPRVPLVYPCVLRTRQRARRTHRPAGGLVSLGRS